MSFDKIKSFLRTASELTEQPASLLDRTSHFISNSFRRASLPTPTTCQFDDYLASLPIIKKGNKKIKSTSSNTLKPELVKRCMQVVQKQYFNDKYEINELIFDKRLKVNSERQLKFQQQLDEVEFCLFNQITSRFDEILSVLRTIESLDCLVNQNQKKLKIIREKHFKKVILVSQKQNKLNHLIRRKKNIQLILALYSKLKYYIKFQQLQNKIDITDTIQIYYNLLPIIKKNLQQYKQFHVTKYIRLKIEEIENKIKRSFSDKINQKIFQYLKKDLPYSNQFWKKYINNRNILEEKEQKDMSAALLDQSTIMGEQQVYIIITPKKDEATQQSILQFMKKGWREGEYSITKLKKDIDAFLKNIHNAFMLDFRDFCDEVSKKYNKDIDNPNLSNLLKNISIIFCTKVYNYFFDIHKSMILRYFSLVKKVFIFILEQSKTNLTIDEKQKINLIGEGFASSGSFLIRIILQKLIDIQQTKIIHQAIDISQIKQLVWILENAQNFLQKLVDDVIIKQFQNTFLHQFFQSLKERYPIKLLEITKKKKLIDYLNKIHNNSLNVELKESLENQVWIPTDIPTFYYDSLHYLITGQSLNLRRNKYNLKNQQNSITFQTSVLMDGINPSQSFFHEPNKLMGNFRIIRNDIIINGQTYKVTQTLLLLLQILQDYMTLTQNFPMIKVQVSAKINSLLRTYNILSYRHIINAQAINFQKIKGKMITSRHLALSSLCLKFVLFVMECIQKRVEIFEGNQLRLSIEQHFDTIIKKLNEIIIKKANSAKPDINLKNTPSKGTESIVSSTKILHEILSQYYDKQTLSRIFTKEFINIYIESISTIQIKSRIEAEALKDDVNFYFGQLKSLENISPEFDKLRIKAEDIVKHAFEAL